MYPKPHHGPKAGMTFTALLERVRYDGAYPTRQRAEQVVRAVLAALGRQLPERERTELAAFLPAEAARVLTVQPADPEPLGGRDFVKALAARTGGTQATARWDTGTVLHAISRLADRALLDRVVAALPPGYALLFGIAELRQQAIAA
jgi:uncharacterized protein (DUF2267 family)